MIKILCFVYLTVITVSSNPLNQLVQSCNTVQPSYNPASTPVQPSNTSPYSQGSTAQGPAGYSGPLGDTLNQILLNKILLNPSLQKIIDPNTKLYNQNGEQVQRQVPSTGPNVINNYFIVPPEFFNLNETVKNNEEIISDERIKKTHRRRRKKPKIIELNSEEDDDEVIVIKTPFKRRKHIEPENVKRKRKRTKNADRSLELIELDESQEVSERERDLSKDRRRPRPKDKDEKIISPLNNHSNEDLEELGEVFSEKNTEKEIKRTRKPKAKSKNKVVFQETHEIITEKPKSKQNKDVILSNDKANDVEEATEFPQEKKSKKEKRKDSADKRSEDKILKNIELPTDISNRDATENRKTRGSKRNASKKSEQKNTAAQPKQTKQNITPFPDEVLNNFFPYMQMGNFYNPNSNNPYNFDQYYQYFNPVRNPNSNRNQRRRKKPNKNNSDPTSKTHTIEIKLKPKKKANTTEPTTESITEPPKDEHSIMVSIEVEESTESLEHVTEIPMEMPHKVSPVINEEDSSKESYETFSKLEDLHEFITPELGKEDEVPTMSSNGIINDYYPIFDDDVYYNPYVERVENLEDDRYFYETGIEDKGRKLDRYEDNKSPKRETNNRDLKNPDFKTKKIDGINKFDHNDYLAHIASFSESDDIKPSTDIMRIKIPPKNTRVKTENVETVYAGSKVAKYGVPVHETDDDSSIHDENTSEGYTYVVAKSLGRPEDYW